MYVCVYEQYDHGLALSVLNETSWKVEGNTGMVKFYLGKIGKELASTNSKNSDFWPIVTGRAGRIRIVVDGTGFREVIRPLKLDVMFPVTRPRLDLSAAFESF